MARDRWARVHDDFYRKVNDYKQKNRASTPYLTKAIADKWSDVERLITPPKPRRKGRMNKKGAGIVDMVFIVLFFVAILFTAVLAFMFTSMLNDGIQDQEAVPQLVKDKVGDFDNRFPLFFDAAIVLYIFILWLGLLATSFILDNHPVFFIFFLLLAVITIFIAAPLANVFYELSNDSVLQAYFDGFPMTMFLVNHWLLLIVFFIVTVGIALYAKFNVLGGDAY